MNYEEFKEQISGLREDPAGRGADERIRKAQKSVLLLEKLGSDLKDAYDLPDRRGDAYYASYDACMERWYSLLTTFTSSGFAEETAE